MARNLVMSLHHHHQHARNHVQGGGVTKWSLTGFRDSLGIYFRVEQGEDEVSGREIQLPPIQELIQREEGAENISPLEKREREHPQTQTP